jgi:hypothetical protein
MSSHWLRLTKVVLLPLTLRRGRFNETLLYELHPNDPSVRKNIPPPHSPTMVPFYHTVIVHNIPSGGTPAEKIKVLKENLPMASEIDYFWCPETKSGQGNNAQGPIFIVCYDAKVAAAVLEYIPQIECYIERLKGEIYVPVGRCTPGDNRVKHIETWSDVILWAGFVGEEMVLAVGARGSSNENDQDLRWLVNHHVQYVPRPLDGKREVTVWLSSVEKIWKPILKDGATKAVIAITQTIVAAIKTRMFCNKYGVGLKLVFEQEESAECFKLWLADKAVHPVTKKRRKVENGRWYIHRYV